MTKSRKIFLVSCVGQKLNTPAVAANFYTSPWFTKVRKQVQKSGQPWFILSAKYGLLAPDTSIQPYDQKLNKMRIDARRDWADRVRREMDERLPDADEITILAGTRYREFLIDWLSGRFKVVNVPMEGMTIGRQLQWLSHAKF